MKKFMIRFFDRLILALLAVAGLTTACDEPMVEYGTPTADYVIKGTVTDSITTQSIKNIRVIRELDENGVYGDTTYTDAKGCYQFSFSGFPDEHPEFRLKTEDIDGDQNGGEFENRKVIVQINSSDRTETGDNHWYLGKAVKKQDFKLHYKVKQ